MDKISGKLKRSEVPSKKSCPELAVALSEQKLALSAAKGPREQSKSNVHLR